MICDLILHALDATDAPILHADGTIAAVMRKDSVLEVSILGIGFSPDNRTLATGDEAGVVKLWDVVTAEELLTLEPHTGRLQ